MNIVLVGPPLSGKSTIGKALSETWQRPFIDTDMILERRVGMSKSDYYRCAGQEAFRYQEKKVLTELAGQAQSVIACGGGMVDQKVKELGSVIYVSVPLDLLWERLLRSGRKPAYLDPYDLQGSFFSHITIRMKPYRLLADFTVRGDRPVADIIEEVGAIYGLE